MDFSMYNVDDERPETLSVEQLKKNLKKILTESGVVNTVNSHVKQELITGLTSKLAVMQPKSMELQDRVVFSLIYHFLKNRKLVNSIAVFMPESGLISSKSLLSESDIVQMIRYNNISNSYKLIQSQKENHESDNHQTTGSKTASILDLMMKFCLTIDGKNSHEMACQTDTGGPGIREFLDIQISELQKTYAKNKELQYLTPTKTIEERMFIFQRECEERFSHDLKLQVAAIRENELLKMRLEEASKCRAQLELQRQELEFEYKERLQYHIERESASARRLSEQEREIHRSQYDSRQLMQREIDELRSREALLSRKTDLETQGLRVLELRLREAQNVLDGREREVARREKALEEHTRECMETARREAHARVQSELEMLSNDRAAYMIEKQRFDDERGAQSSLIDSAKSLRVQLKTAVDEVQAREDEISHMRRTAERLSAIRAEEDLQIEEMLRSVLKDGKQNTDGVSRPQQIIALIQLNAQLQVRLAALKDPRGLESMIAKAQEELTAAQNALSLLQRQYDSDIYLMKTEIDHLNRMLLEEVAKVATLDRELKEAQTTLRTKNRAIETLAKLDMNGSAAASGNAGSAGRGTYPRTGHHHAHQNSGQDLFYANTLLSRPEYSRNIPNSSSLQIGSSLAHHDSLLQQPHHLNSSSYTSQSGAFGHGYQQQAPPPLQPNQSLASAGSHAANKAKTDAMLRFGSSLSSTMFDGVHDQANAATASAGATLSDDRVFNTDVSSAHTSAPLSYSLYTVPRPAAVSEPPLQHLPISSAFSLPRTQPKEMPPKIPISVPSVSLATAMEVPKHRSGPLKSAAVPDKQDIVYVDRDTVQYTREGDSRKVAVSSLSDTDANRSAAPQKRAQKSPDSTPVKAPTVFGSYKDRDGNQVQKAVSPTTTKQSSVASQTQARKLSLSPVIVPQVASDSTWNDSPGDVDYGSDYLVKHEPSTTVTDRRSLSHEDEFAEEERRLKAQYSAALAAEQEEERLAAEQRHEKQKQQTQREAEQAAHAEAEAQKARELQQLSEEELRRQQVQREWEQRAEEDKREEEEEQRREEAARLLREQKIAAAAERERARQAAALEQRRLEEEEKEQERLAAQEESERRRRAAEEERRAEQERLRKQEEQEEAERQEEQRRIAARKAERLAQEERETRAREEAVRKEREAEEERVRQEKEAQLRREREEREALEAARKEEERKRMEENKEIADARAAVMERRRLQKLRESTESIGSGNIRQSTVSLGSDDNSDDGHSGFPTFKLGDTTGSFNDVRESRDSVLRASTGSGFTYGGNDHDEESDVENEDTMDVIEIGDNQDQSGDSERSW